MHLGLFLPLGEILSVDVDTVPTVEGELAFGGLSLEALSRLELHVFELLNEFSQMFDV